MKNNNWYYGKSNVIGDVNIRNKNRYIIARWHKNRIGLIRDYNSKYYETLFKGKYAIISKRFIDKIELADESLATRMKKLAKSEISTYKIARYYRLYGKWCQSFINWLALSAGAEAVPNTSSCPRAILWFIKHKEFYFVNTIHKAKMERYSSLVKNMSVTNYKASVGDIVYFRYSMKDHASHVGFVYAVNDKYITTIEGNTSKKVDMKRHSINSKYIIGYGKL